MTLFWLCIAWLGGIVAADGLGLPFVPALALAAGSAALGLIWRRTPVAWPFALLAALSGGAVRSVWAQPMTDATAVWSYVGSNVVLTGTVAQHPDWRDDAQIVVIAAEHLEIGNTGHQVRGRVRIQLGPVPEMRYGERVEVSGDLALPDIDPTFDFRAYLRRQSIYAVMDNPAIEVVGVDAQRAPLAALLALNTRLRATLLRLLPEPHAGLLAGMLLGTRSAIPRPVTMNFRATGTSHLLVISGWNITVLAGALVGLQMALGVGRRLAAGLTIPVILLYVLFTGASPGIIRAGIMGGLVLWATIADREPDTWTGLALACAVLALVDPNVLWDVGFQLSVAGTTGIVAWAIPLKVRLKTLQPLQRRLMWSIVETLAATLTALVFVLPILLYTFGNLQLIAPLANVLLAPAVPFAMLFGICALAASMIALPLGQLVALCAWPFTTWLLVWTRLLTQIPLAQITIPPFHVGWVWVCYAALAAATIWRLRGKW